MKVAAIDFIKSPAVYLGKVSFETVHITEEGRTVAMLVKPSNTPISDSLVGLLKGTEIKNSDDIKAMKVGV